MMDDGQKAGTLNEILVLSYGTSFSQARSAEIGGIERAVGAAYPDWIVRRGFTSDIVIRHVLRKDGEKIDGIVEAFQRAADCGVRRLVIQPTHLTRGREYGKIVSAAAAWSDRFERVSVGAPLFGDGSDRTAFDQVADALAERGKRYDDGSCAIVCVGHGVDAESNVDYRTLQQELQRTGRSNYYVTTLCGRPGAAETLTAIRNKGYSRVLLRPLMVVSGSHVFHEMASAEPDSLRSRFEDAGYKVDCLLEGLGRDPAFQQLYAARVREAIGRM